ERLRGRRYASTYAGDLHGLPVNPLSLRAQRLHARQGRSAIGSGRKIGEARRAFSESAKHRVTMTDRFVSRQTQAAKDVPGGANDSFLGGDRQMISDAMRL